MMKEPSFGVLLKQYRLEARLSQAMLAERATISARAISNLERGINRRPRSETLDTLLQALPLSDAQQQALIASARPAFPVVHVSSNPLFVLPSSPTRLVGREQECARVFAWFREKSVRLLTLTGPPGVGKTHLALEMAHRLSADFNDGLVFVSLASLSDPLLVPSQVAQALKLREDSSSSTSEQICSFLSEKHLLLVIDNFEQVIDAASFVAQLVQHCPSLRLLVTSRIALHLRSEQEFPLEPLSVEAAVTLFQERAQARQPNRESSVAVVAAICQRLDRLPLAIELAVAQVKVLSLQQLLERLEHRLPLLQSGARDVPQRQKTMRAALTWSYDLLAPLVQHLFRQLAVFAGGWMMEAASALTQGAGTTHPDVLNMLASLLDHSLISQSEQETEEPRFLMLQTVREYGLELLAVTGELQTTQAAHAHFFLALAERAEPELLGPHQAMWADRLEREHDNLRGALSYLFEEAGGVDLHLKTASQERALRFVGALWSFWYIHCHYREGKQWLQAALALLAEETASSQTQEMSEGNVLSHASNREQVQVLPTRIRAKILTGAGVFEQLHDPNGARPFHEESLNASRSAGDRLGMIAALNDLAWVALRQGNYEQADRLSQQSLVLGRALADTQSIAASLLVLGSVALHQHKYEQARPFLEECLRLRQLLEERSGCAHALHLLGYLAVLQEEHLRVRPLILESMRLRREEGNIQGIGMNVIVLAELAVAQKQPHRAVRLLAAEQKLREAIGFSESGIPVFIRERIEWVQRSTRAQLSKATFSQMWTEGRDMELAQLLTYAFEDDSEAGEFVLVEQQEQVSTHEPLLSVSQSVADVPAPSRFPNSLTPREMDVLRLLAQGLTNAQIAKQLIIGVTTVNFHVRSIYSKLGVSSRASATRYALEHHLV